MALALGACASVQRVAPAGELVAVGLASERRYELASSVAANRAYAAAAKLTRPRSMTFVYQRERGVARLKLFVPPVTSSGNAKVEARQPFGARATVAVKRTADDMAALAKLESVHQTARVQGLDLAVALMRAERDLFKQAIEAFAKAKKRSEPTLNGALSLLDYRLTDDGQAVLLDVQVAVEFDVSQRAATSAGFDVDREEIEPPSEQIGAGEAASLPASLPASAPASAPVKGKP